MSLMKKYILCVWCVCVCVCVGFVQVWKLENKRRRGDITTVQVKVPFTLLSNGLGYHHTSHTTH